MKERIQELSNRLTGGDVPDVPVNAFGVDFSWGSPSVATFKDAGVKFVANYFSNDTSKDLTPAEAKAWTAAGIPVVVVWESTANRALSGSSGGQADAKQAKAKLGACHPKRASAPIYFAVDWDATDAQKPTIANYLKGAASELGKDRVGVYGSYYVCKYMLENDACKFAWQTYAWSGGQEYSGTHLYQYSNGHNLGGAGIDYDKSRKADFGQWFAD